MIVLMCLATWSGPGTSQGTAPRPAETHRNESLTPAHAFLLVTSLEPHARCPTMNRTSRSSSIVGLLASAALFSAGCGSDAPPSDAGPKAEEVEAACALVPGCMEPRVAVSQAREDVWRVEVVRTSSGGYRIGRVEALEVVEGRGVPVGPTWGPHLLMGVDGDGEPVDGQFVRFPGFLRAEGGEDWEGADSVSLAGREVSVVGYVRALPAVRRLVLLDDEGEEVVSSALPRGGSRSALRPGSGRGLPGKEPQPQVASRGPGSARVLAASLPLPWPWAASPRAVLEVAPAGLGLSLPVPAAPSFTPPPHCAHVMLLEGEADRHWAEGIYYEGEVALVVPGPTQRAVLQGALGLMTPLLCHGISRVAVGVLDSKPGVGGAVQQLSTGDMMFLNVSAGYGEDELAASQEARVRMMHTVLHEAAHSAEALLNAEGARPGGFAGMWRPPSRALADETLDRVRLHKSLIQEWQRVHFSFQGQQWAAAYPGSQEERKAIRDRSAQDVAQGGFMSRYGGSSYAEDIADMVAWTYMAPHYRSAGIPDGVRQTEDYGCQLMRSHGERDLPSRLAAVYTKLHFLHDLGLVMTEDVALCTGAVMLPVGTPGFHFWQGGEVRRSFDTGVQARIGTTRGRYVYEMEGEGRASFDDTDYPASARLVLDLDAASVPVEEVAWPRGVYPLGLLARNSFQLRLDGAAAGNFDVHDGFALVAEASNERIAGSVFIRVAFRLNAPIPVPQTFDPPLVVRFLIEK